MFYVGWRSVKLTPPPPPTHPTPHIPLFLTEWGREGVVLLAPPESCDCHMNNEEISLNDWSDYLRECHRSSWASSSLFSSYKGRYFAGCPVSTIIPDTLGDVIRSVGRRPRHRPSKTWKSYVGHHQSNRPWGMGLLMRFYIPRSSSASPLGMSAQLEVFIRIIVPKLELNVMGAGVSF